MEGLSKRAAAVMVASAADSDKPLSAAMQSCRWEEKEQAANEQAGEEHSERVTAVMVASEAAMDIPLSADMQSYRQDSQRQG